MATGTLRSSLTALLTAGVLLTSCSSSPEPPPEPTDAPSAGESPSATAQPSRPSPSSTPGTGDAPTSGLQPFPEHTGPAQADASSGAQLYLMELTGTEHEGYDRVVLTFEGSGTPGWHVDYQANPAADGSGRPIQVDGDAALVAHVSGLVLPTEGDGQLAPETSDPDLPEIDELHVDGWFEGQVQLVLGIDSAQAPFRVFPLTDPTRLVIDVQHVEG